MVATSELMVTTSELMVATSEFNGGHVRANVGLVRAIGGHVRAIGGHVRAIGGHVRAHGGHVRANGGHVRAIGGHVRAHGGHFRVKAFEVINLSAKDVYLLPSLLSFQMDLFIKNMNESTEEDDTKDSIRLAEQVRQLQGSHEKEVFFGNEGDLHQHFKRCSKNPRHETFIPVDTFTVSHLPVRYQDEDVFQLIKFNAYLTVRITCPFTSHERPEFYTGTARPFPFYNYRGKPMIRLGTGRAWSTRVYKDADNRPCPCSKCAGTGNKIWGKVSVYTARHVVYDEAEGRKAVCKWGYDSDEKKNRNLTIDLEGVGIGVADYEGDTSEVICATHDLGLVESITQARMNYMRLNAKVYRKCKDRVDGLRLVAIASHPHGCSKQITVGEWKHRMDVRDEETVYIYTTATCPGSSGASLYIMGRLGVGHSHVHSGGSDTGNCSGYWLN
ncbi:hypothetical protein Btru_071071 [Bulinus truncatus]|nr:hypothetical protein Btru_071071 [Bulinus truncatus]